jgi:hypothetical protein
VAGRVHRGRQCTRNQDRRPPVYLLKMGNQATETNGGMRRALNRVRCFLPRPTPQFRRRSWLEFQRALDPLAAPKPLRGRRQH